MSCGVNYFVSKDGELYAMCCSPRPFKEYQKASMGRWRGGEVFDDITVPKADRGVP